MNAPNCEQAEREVALIEQVVNSFANTQDERLREILTSLVRHLQAS